MIKCDKKAIEVQGSLMDVAAQFGMIAEGIITFTTKVPKEVVAELLAKMRQTAIDRTLKEGEKNEKFEQLT